MAAGFIAGVVAGAVGARLLPDAFRRAVTGVKAAPTVREARKHLESALFHARRAVQTMYSSQTVASVRRSSGHWAAAGQAMGQALQSIDRLGGTVPDYAALLDRGYVNNMAVGLPQYAASTRAADNVTASELLAVHPDVVGRLGGDAYGPGLIAIYQDVESRL